MKGAVVDGELVDSLPGDLGTYFATLLERRPALQLLDLSANGLGDSGITVLLQAMRRPGLCHQLSYLGLAKNDITDVGGRRVATWLGVTAAPLQHLEMRDNSLGNGSAAALAAVLSENKMLQHLSLLHNEIGQDGARARCVARTQPCHRVTSTCG